MADTPTSRFTDAVDDCILTIVGNEITEGPQLTTATLHKKMYHDVRKYINENRFNSDFRAEIIKRKNTFYNFVFEPIDAAMKERLLARYPEQLPKEAVLQKLWNRFKAIQSAIRNNLLPKYKTDYFSKSTPSGTYTGDEEVLSKIWMRVRKEEILHNSTQV